MFFFPWSFLRKLPPASRLPGWTATSTGTCSWRWNGGNRLVLRCFGMGNPKFSWEAMGKSSKWMDLSCGIVQQAMCDMSGLICAMSFVMWLKVTHATTPHSTTKCLGLHLLKLWTGCLGQQRRDSTLDMSSQETRCPSYLNPKTI